MKKTEAKRLRGFIIEQFKSAPSLNQLTANLKVKRIEDWALSVEEVMELNPDKPEQFYMAQMEKIALILGCSPKDSMKIAIESYAHGVKKGLC